MVVQDMLACEHWPSGRIVCIRVKERKFPASVRGLATNVANYTQGNAVCDEKSYINNLPHSWPALDSMLISSSTPAATESSPPDSLHGADWCNVIDTGFGVRPTTDTGDKLADVFVWVKPGGESDGTSDTSAKRYDVKCGLQDALKPAPEAGTWFQAYFEQLLRNANPSFWTRAEDHWTV